MPPDSDQYPRFYGGQTCSEGQTLALPRNQSEHLARVLRRSEGDLVRVFTGEGREFLAEVTRADPHAAEVKIRRRLRTDETGGTTLALAFAPPRGERSDFVVEKATELGVDHLQPLICERLQSHRLRDAAGRTRRWWRKAVDAARQCERLTVPHVEEPVALEAYLESDRHRVRLAGDLREGISTLWHTLERTASPPDSMALLVGPVGGFTRPERKAMERAGVQPVSLGENVLRVETAAVAMLGVVCCWLHARQSG